MEKIANLEPGAIIARVEKCFNTKLPITLREFIDLYNFKALPFKKNTSNKTNRLLDDFEEMNLLHEIILKTPKYLTGNNDHYIEEEIPKCPCKICHGSGSHRTIQHHKIQTTCNKCNEHGNILKLVKCYACDSTGIVGSERTIRAMSCPLCWGKMKIPKYVSCYKCKGEKIVFKNNTTVIFTQCIECKGSGTIKVKES